MKVTKYSIMVFIIGILLAAPFVYIAKLKKLDRPSFPRFTSTKSSEVNVRNGPGLQYPIKLVFKSKNEPVKVVGEFEYWRKIIDVDGEEGWVHSSVLSRGRFVVINLNDKLLANPNDTVVAEVSANSRCKLVKCKKAWCKLECYAKNSVVGWMHSQSLWGLYDDER